MDGNRRRPVPLSESGGWVDDVPRMKAFLERHPEVTWLRPGQAGVTDQTATWIEADADPRVDGTPVTVSRYRLGHLVDYLEARFDRRPSLWPATRSCRSGGRRTASGRRSPGTGRTCGMRCTTRLKRCACAGRGSCATAWCSASGGMRRGRGADRLESRGRATLPIYRTSADSTGAVLDRLSPPALAMLHVTTRVLELSQRVAAGDEDAAADVERMAALLAGNG